MNKFFISTAAAVSLLSTVLPVAHAAVESNGFTVDVALTSKCLATTTSAPSLAFAYESFQTGDSLPTAPISLTFKCTRGIAAPTLSFDTVSGTTTAGSTSGATGEGVVGGLRYTLAVGGNTSTNQGTAASNTAIGSEKVLSYSVTGKIQLGQAGDATASAQQIRSLIVTY